MKLFLSGARILAGATVIASLVAVQPALADEVYEATAIFDDLPGELHLKIWDIPAEHMGGTYVVDGSYSASKDKDASSKTIWLACDSGRVFDDVQININGVVMGETGEAKALIGHLQNVTLSNCEFPKCGETDSFRLNFERAEWK